MRGIIYHAIGQILLQLSNQERLRMARIQNAFSSIVSIRKDDIKLDITKTAFQDLSYAPD
jgi:hypothetical protein